jgi:hypothetical protein
LVPSLYSISPSGCTLSSPQQAVGYSAYSLIKTNSWNSILQESLLITEIASFFLDSIIVDSILIASARLELPIGQIPQDH